MEQITNVLRVDQFLEDELLNRVIEQAQEYKAGLASPEQSLAFREELLGSTMFNLFYEPSTRTSFSFQMAAANLGMDVIGTESAGLFSSAAKGETLRDTATVLAGYKPSVIVLRHNQDGAAEELAAHSQGVPVINAGDGKNEHPTQALLDVFTIQESLGRRDNLRIVIGGDIAHGRTAKSLIKLLGKYSSNEFTLIAPQQTNADKEMQSWLAKMPATTKYAYRLTAKALENADVVYWTRTQTERGAGEGDKRFRLEPKHLSRMNPNGIVMHPLPRVNELSEQIDCDPRAQYFEQAANGVPVRMALLKLLLGKFY